jgi:hypothetical protein
MVGLLGKQESGEVEGIDEIFFKEFLIHLVFFENRDIVIDDIMAADIIGPGGFGFQEMLKIFNGRVVEMGIVIPGADILDVRLAVHFQVEKQYVFHC